MDIKKLIIKAEFENAAVSARVEVLDTVISDFFRMYLGAKDATKDEIVAGLESLSNKLLAMQAAAVDAKEATGKAAHDMQVVMLQQAQQAMQAQASDAAPPLAAVPKPELSAEGAGE